MYKKNLLTFILGLLLAFAGTAFAENSQDFGDYVVHFNALGTTQLPPTVTKEYGIKRSKNRGMINIAILRKVLGTTGNPVSAEVSASATNLTGQKRDIALREIREGTAIYYIGDFPITNEEVLRFTVHVKPEGQKDRYEVNFKQQFFTR
ncbi:MAG TPA: DUF4426 domain-containing protein [Gammaproteobacteria bacterium]|nr:DUF4426 domain-containing protein [Gammaproteobacteria bacterium]